MSELKRVLYVEDEPDIRAVAELALGAVGGFELCTCESGEQAVREAVAFAPDLMILDVMMPGMDGPSTLRALRAMPEMAGVPAIFMTAKVQPEEVKQLLALGALEVIPKPFDPMTLAQRVMTVWERRDS
ncbi:response regulator [Alcanivorax sp. JB21]|uniref:response regulator n=1 Tax=Alcanivorax limicola TaxID=2874102 RepID=UPI001CBB481E|nr:response regulator [Alcanivorax limicola]MBZ2189361.1 response regulator [Alcanivorax limicola]